jgi:DNA polymerase elongation subunit (family B)
VDEQRNLYRIQIADKRLTPRFYILESDTKFLDQARAVMREKIVKWEPCKVPDRFGRKIITVYTQKKRDVVHAREFFTTHYQAKIEWHKMAMIELGLGEWIDVDLSQYKYGFLNINAIKPAQDPGWEWQDRTCWIDTEWNAKELDHVPRWNEAPHTSCFLICNIDESTNTGAMFSVRGHTDFEEVYLSTRIGAQTGLPDTMKVERYRCENEKEMFNKWMDWFSTRGFTTISGHNIGGGWIVTGSGREWRNGFDLPLMHERMLHLGIDDTRLSPLGKVYSRIEDTGKYELMVKGILIFDWLYGWKFSRYWEDQKKVEEEDGQEVETRLKGNGLDELGRFFFNHGKARTNDDLKIFYPGTPDFDIGKWQVWQLHESFPDLSEFYCWIDTVLSYSLERLLSPKHDVMSVAYLVGAPPEDAMLATRYHKVLTYRMLRDKMVLESDLLDMGKGIKEGAMVVAGKKGLHKWVISIDFKSMYPSIYLTMNAGIDTIIEPDHLAITINGLVLVDKGNREFKLNELIFAPSGAIFSKRFDSVDRIIFDNFGKKRSEKKKLRDAQAHGSFLWKKNEGEQKRLKVCMNSRFGIAPTDIFNTATMTGKYLLNSVIEMLGELVANGDTDGVQVLVDATNLQEALAKGAELIKRINAHVAEIVKEFGCDTNYLKMELKAVADRLLVHLKKMYIMRKVWEEGKVLDPPEYEFKGFKPKRSDSSQAMDDLFNRSIDVIMSADNMVSAGKNYSSFLRRWHAEFPKHKPEYMAVTKSLSRYADQYKNTYESRAVTFTKTFFGKEYMPGETFFMMALEETPAKINGKDVLRQYVTPNAVLAFDKLNLHFLEGMKIDYREMERKTAAAISPLLEMLDLDYDRVVSFSGGGLFRR